MNINTTQIESAASRYEQREKHRLRNERLIQSGQYFKADSPERVEKFLTRQGFTQAETSNILRQGSRGLAATKGSTREHHEPSALERMVGTNDLMGVAFFERGLQVARSVGRIWINVTGGMPEGYGTGFLISPHLLMTNHHVLPTQAIAKRSLVELDYQLGLNGTIMPTATFSFEPDLFFLANQHLDYAVVAVRTDDPSGQSLAGYGWNPLIEEEGKTIISQWLNIIQHPNGEPKQLGLRENQLVDVLDEFLHYKTDTAPGSSGAPVYNDRWEVVGLHHSGVWDKNAAGHPLAIDGRVWREEMGEHRIKWIANEGVRISRIIADIHRQSMNTIQQKLFEGIFISPPQLTETVGEKSPFVPAIASPMAQVSVGKDGSATWTLPLSISIQLGAMGIPTVSTIVSSDLTSSSNLTDRQSSLSSGGTSFVQTISDPDAIVEAAKQEIGSRTDVLDVRLGYVFRNGWITKDRAIVVTVRQKLSPAKLQTANIAALPEMFRGLPVEVTNPSIEDLIQVAYGAGVREAFFPSLATLPEEITYVSPTGVALEPVTETLHVIAHVSPDAGWTNLSAFLAETKKRLVVGMYDFGAPHIVDAVQKACQKRDFQKLTLVMQRGESVGEGTKTNDLRDSEVVERLETKLDRKFENAWVKIGSVNGWVSSSYHIKVAVRDQKAFWLSSGNWQSSNQPKAEPLNESPPQRQWIDRYNREWHAIIEHEGLAKVFETYLLHDYNNNKDSGQEAASFPSVELPDFLIPEAFFVSSLEERTTAFKYFQPFDENRVFSVRPLLTPDNYQQHVLALVKSAQKELLIQNQTFNAPKDGHDQLKELIDAVLMQQQKGVKIQIIFRILDAGKVRENLEKLQDYGFNMDSFKVQKNCHTKGIIVDRKKVLLGSQNWSNDGVSVNRDASLLFDDDELAEYFATIFDHDWSNLARNNIGSESLPLELATSSKVTPPGMVRLTWQDYMEMR
jgi:V8-like Glu-specific endopeptidase